MERPSPPSSVRQGQHASSLGMMEVYRRSSQGVDATPVASSHQSHLATRSTPQVPEPGAVAVNNLDDDEFSDDFTLTAPSGVHQPSNSDVAVEAELVNTEEDDRKMQERLERELQERLERERIERERNIAVAEIVSDGNRSSSSRRLCIIGIVTVVLVAVVLSVVLTQVLQPKPLPSQVSAPTSPAASPAPTSILEDLTELLSDVSLDGGAALATRSTPQNSALMWLSGNVNINSYSYEKKLQRYVLATLYYTTNGDEWKDTTGWLSDEDECTSWYNRVTDGVVGLCNNEGGVAFLDLVGNNLSGVIPDEIALLSDSLGK